VQRRCSAARLFARRAARQFARFIYTVTWIVMRPPPAPARDSAPGATSMLMVRLLIRRIMRPACRAQSDAAASSLGGGRS